MATADSQNKSAFLRDLFGKNPNVKLEQATEAWQEAGNVGEVSSSLFYNVKRAVGERATAVAGEGGEAPRKPKGKAMAKGPKGKRRSEPVDEAPPEPNGMPANTPRAALRKSASGERERVLDQVEDGIDDLILELKHLGGMEDALESLRKVRRVVVRSHEG